LAAILVVATLIDFALAALLVGVSGFILEGVNNSGPEMPAAAMLVGFIILCFAAPIAAWLMRARGYRPAAFLALTCAPLMIAAVILLLEPLLVH
jgi:MFS-type transporter involved in bile tolerance (Atg22 family)